jgi:hypothetical protein
MYEQEHKPKGISEDDWQWQQMEAFLNQVPDVEERDHDHYDDDDGEMSWEDIARWCLKRIDDHRLTEWHRQFIKGMVIWIEQKDLDPTRKQAKWLELIFVQLGG